MPNMFSTGTSALIGYQRSLAAVGNNVANASTPGYSRQVAELSTRSTDGVQVQDVKRITDSLATNRVLDSTGERNRLEALTSNAAAVDSLMSDTATNLGGTWSNFFDSLSALGTDPSSSTSRQATLQSANALAGRFRQLDASLDGLGDDVNATLTGTVKQVNDLTTQIAKLNRDVVHANSASLDVLDKRDHLIEQLVGLTGGKVVNQDDGSLNVYTSGGQPLVVGATAMTMTTVGDPYRSDRLGLALVAPGQTIPLGENVVGGALGGVLEFRRDVLEPAINELGRLATAVAGSLNDAQAAGVDIYGNTGTPMFTLDPPAVRANAGNTGTASLQAAVADVGALDGADVVLAFDGTAWTATRADTGAALPLSGTGTAADPLRVDGVAIAVGGAAAAGDSFLVSPTSSAAGSLQVAFTDPGLIAAARAVQGTADLDNVGNARVGRIDVVDPADPALRTPVDIQFIDQTQYTIDGAGPYAYASGDTIGANGWQFVLDGAPAAGDHFTIGPVGPGSSDNGNVLAMSSLDESKLLDGGTISLNGGLSALTTSVASQAAQANYAYDSEQSIYNQAVAARDAISGVNLDQEAADLIKYQQAYQAAAKIISSADTIFQTLLQAV